ncbi:MAG: hypothetical protein D6719_09510 [Candidatus Dadabacteria bacterium]|nr:MAG: hypothetical protein D6719_09510 [Candidatus Dadabacteria bacterium]
MANTVKSTQKEFLFFYKTGALYELTVALLLMLVLALTRLNGFLNIDTRFLGGAERDAGFYIWLVKSNVLYPGGLPWFNTTAFYPYGLSLAWSDNFILPSLVVSLLLKVGFGFTAAYNTVLLLAIFLNGYLTYRLVYTLSGNYGPSLISGVALLTYSYLTLQLGHPQLQFFFFIPLAVFFLFRFLGRKNPIYAVLLGFTAFLSFLCSVYYTIFIGVVCGALMLALVVLKPQALRFRDYAVLSLGTLLGLLPVMPFVLPYLEVQKAFGARGIYESYYFAATALSYLSAPADNIVYGITSRWARAEAQLFPGLTILLFLPLAFGRLAGAKPFRKKALLFLVSFAGFLIFSVLPKFLPQIIPPQGARYVCSALGWFSLVLFLIVLRSVGSLEEKLGYKIVTNRNIIGIFIFIALAACFVSFGPLGNPEKGDLATGLSAVLYYILPGFSAIRAVSRIGVVVVFSLSVLVGLMASHLLDREKVSNRFIAVLLALILVENAMPHYALEQIKSAPGIVGEVMRFRGDNDVAIVVPFTDRLDSNGRVVSWGKYAETNVRYMNWFLPTGVRLVNGYSGQRSRIMKDFPRKMSGFPDKRSIISLSTIAGLRFIVFNSNLVADFKEEEFLKKIQQSKSVRYLSSDRDGYYLLEFEHLTNLRELYYLKTPSYPRGNVYLELMAPKGKIKENKDISVYVYEWEHMGKTPLAKFPVKKDGEWHTFVLITPDSGERVRPLKLTFEIEGEGVVFLRERRFLPRL